MTRLSSTARYANRPSTASQATRRRRPSAIALNPHVLRKSIGDNHLRAGRLEQAVRAYHAALAFAPGYGRVWDRLGIAQLRRGDRGAADLRLALLALEERRASDAGWHLEAARALDPELPVAKAARPRP